MLRAPGSVALAGATFASAVATALPGAVCLGEEDGFSDGFACRLGLAPVLDFFFSVSANSEPGPNFSFISSPMDIIAF